MTITDALAWADARQVDRWRLVRETSHPSETDIGTAYAQMDADAMGALADFCRMVPAVDREAERAAVFRAGYEAGAGDYGQNHIVEAWLAFQATQETQR